MQFNKVVLHWICTLGRGWCLVFELRLSLRNTLLSCCSWNLNSSALWLLTPLLLVLTLRPFALMHVLSFFLVARETAQPSRANGHHFRQASEGGRSRPRSWTLYRYTRTHSLCGVFLLLTLPVLHLTSNCFLMPRFLHIASLPCHLPDEADTS